MTYTALGLAKGVDATFLSWWVLSPASGVRECCVYLRPGPSCSTARCSAAALAHCHCLHSRETPLAIKARIDSGQTDVLMKEVLPNWEPWLPPKQDQAFLQGGMLIFEVNGSAVWDGRWQCVAGRRRARAEGMRGQTPTPRRALGLTAGLALHLQPPRPLHVSARRPGGRLHCGVPACCALWHACVRRAWLQRAAHTWLAPRHGATCRRCCVLRWRVFPPRHEPG